MRRTKSFTWMILAVLLFAVGCSEIDNVEKGNAPIKIMNYNEKKECIGESTLDKYGNVIQTSVITDENEAIISSKIVYEYDKLGNILKMDYQSEKTKYIEEYKYDQYGNITYKKHMEDSEEYVIEYQYTYEDEIISTCERIQDGKVEAQIKYTYDGNGNLIEEYASVPGSELVNIEEKQYDANNNVIKTSLKMIADSIEQVVTYEYENEYDEENRIKNITQYFVNDGERQFVIEQEYVYE